MGKSQAPDITIGTMNIGQGENTTLFKIGDYACSVAYATVENGDIKVGDPVSIYDVTGVKSLTVTGDINLHGNVTFKTNVWNEDAMASHSEYSPDILVQGVVRMTQSDGGENRSGTCCTGREQFHGTIPNPPCPQSTRS